jgi:hypothetical protein
MPDSRRLGVLYSVKKSEKSGAEVPPFRQAMRSFPPAIFAPHPLKASVQSVGLDTAWGPTGSEILRTWTLTAITILADFAITGSHYSVFSKAKSDLWHS